MGLLSNIATAVVGIEHIYILTLEMFLWTKPKGRKTFGLTPEFAEQTKGLAANQGLYNGFLAAGLFWGLVHPVEDFATQLKLFFLGTVVVAGAYGGATVKRNIWFVQMTPAIVSFGIVYLGL